MTVALAPLRLPEPANEPDRGSWGPDLLARLVSPALPRPTIDHGLAGGLRAWLDDGIAGVGRAGTPERPVVGRAGTPERPVVVRDGTLVRSATLARPSALGLRELRACLTRMVFRLTLVQGALRHPLEFEDALCAISVTEHGPELLDAVGRLHPRERASLGAFTRARASVISAQWRPVPAAWLPRTGERLRAPLGGGAVVVHATADLVLGKPSEGAASVCLVRLHDEHRGPLGTARAQHARRALALAETLRSGAPPWRVATYDPGARHLDCDEVTEELLADAVRDVLEALERG